MQYLIYTKDTLYISSEFPDYTPYPSLNNGSLRHTAIIIWFDYTRRFINNVLQECNSRQMIDSILLKQNMKRMLRFDQSTTEIKRALTYLFVGCVDTAEGMSWLGRGVSV